MTESFPFGALEDVPDEQESAAPSRTRALLLGGGLVAVAAAVAGVLLLGGGDEQEVLGTGFALPAPAAAAPSPTATPGALPPPFDEALGRDPFRALYVQPVAAAAPVEPADPTLPSSAPAAAAPAPAAGAPVAAPAGDDEVPQAGVPVSAPEAPQGPTAQEHALVLKRVYGAGKDLTAEFTIDGRKTLAKVGVRFGPTDEIRLISLQQGPAASEWTAVLQVGDGEPFDAVTGDEVSVR